MFYYYGLLLYKCGHKVLLHYNIIYIYIYIYIYIEREIYIYIYIVLYYYIRLSNIRTIVVLYHDSVVMLLYGQFSEFQICFCGLDPGKLNFETVRTNKQHVCF